MLQALVAISLVILAQLISSFMDWKYVEKEQMWLSGYSNGPSVQPWFVTHRVPKE